GGPLAPPLDQAIDRDLAIAQKAAEPNFLGSLPTADTTHAYARARDHAIEQRRPPLSRRRSPNRPSDHSAQNMPTLRLIQSAWDRITRRARKEIPNPCPESLRRTKMCACSSACGERSTARQRGRVRGNLRGATPSKRPLPSPPPQAGEGSRESTEN